MHSNKGNVTAINEPIYGIKFKRKITAPHKSAYLIPKIRQVNKLKNPTPKLMIDFTVIYF